MWILLIKKYAFTYRKNCKSLKWSWGDDWLTLRRTDAVKSRVNGLLLQNSFLRGNGQLHCSIQSSAYFVKSAHYYKGKLHPKRHRNIPGSVWLYMDTLTQLGCLLIFFYWVIYILLFIFKPKILAKSVCCKYLPKFHIFSFVTWFLWYKLPLGACLVFETQSHCVAQAGLEITV